MSGSGAVSAPSAPPLLKVGEKGLLLLRATFTPTAPIRGEVTGALYPFNQRQMLYVDARDAVFLLGEDFVLVSNE